MTVNLLDLFTSQYNEPLVRQASSALGESAESVIAGIDISSKAILSGIVRKAKALGGLDEWIYAAMPADWSQVSDIDANDIFIQPNLDHYMAAGASMLKTLFGDRQNDIMDYVSSHARLKSSSSSTLLKLIAPLMLRTIASYRQETGLGRMDTRKVLDEQLPYLQATLPIDLQTQIEANQAMSTPSGSSVPGAAAVSPATKNQLLPWIILLITALGLFYFVEKGCAGKAPATKPDQEMGIDSTKMDSI